MDLKAAQRGRDRGALGQEVESEDGRGSTIGPAWKT